jgi:hypothetical protein
VSSLSRSLFFLVMIVGHYICILVLEWNGKKADGVNNAFNTSLGNGKEELIDRVPYHTVPYYI